MEEDLVWLWVELEGKTKGWQPPRGAGLPPRKLWLPPREVWLAAAVDACEQPEEGAPGARKGLGRGRSTTLPEKMKIFGDNSSFAFFTRSDLLFIKGHHKIAWIVGPGTFTK